MARVTVEDCIEKVPNRFELVLLASKRARELSAGAQPTVPRNNDKNHVIALREISEETISLSAVRESLIKKFQKISFHEELGDDFGKDFENEDINLGNDSCIFNDDPGGLEGDEDEEDSGAEDENYDDADFEELEEE